jgi:ABC-type proline/glycine betaine transport system substrate-binding protein
MMKKIATALAITLALTAMASARPLHHQPAAGSTVDSGYGPPSNWNDIEISTPSGGF